mmetsp:Transcript_6248/g.13721  ORF Transcript_6248/g.13721 Transcript_6248/m.13721 type:complete len:184 (+) Transcript_6248:79-630(+)
MGAETDLIIRSAPLLLGVALLAGTVGAFSVSPHVPPPHHYYADVSSIHRQGPKSSKSSSNNKGNRNNSSKQSTSNNGRSASRLSTRMNLSSSDDEEQSRQDKLSALGYTESEISRSAGNAGRIDDPTPPPGEQDVFVEEFEVDAATLTAVGFGLIALNFFVFANLGDGGIGGLVASLINSSRY